MGFSLSDVKNSNYLTKDDVGEQGWNLTISSVSMEMLEADGKEEQKLTLHFVEREYAGRPVKPIVCNVENFMRVCKVLGVNPEDENVTDRWPGTRINIFNDPYVSFGARQTGGIRVRPATDSDQGQAMQQAQQQAQTGQQTGQQQAGQQNGPPVDQYNQSGPNW